jgi:hypothetical protein
VRNPREIFVAKLDLGIDKTLLKELGSLAKHQLADPVLAKIREKLESDLGKIKERYMIRDHVLYCKDSRTHPYWRAIIPRQLEYRVINYVHTLLRQQGTDKCMYQISQSFYLRSLGRKMRKYVAHCDVCQRAKHPNRAYEIEKLSHLPTKPGELMTLDLYGSTVQLRAVEL